MCHWVNPRRSRHCHGWTGGFTAPSGVSCSGHDGLLIKRADLDFAPAAGTFHEPQFDPLVEKESQNEICVSFDYFTFAGFLLGLQN